MKIKEITRQHRRDFIADYECDHCGFVVTKSGYDDENFHVNVIPMMECPKCGKVAKDTYRPLATKYPADLII